MSTITILVIICISLSFGIVALLMQLHRYKVSHQYDIENMDSFVEWIVNDAGELGVKIGNRAGFLYKGYTIEYGNQDGDIKKYRDVYKREFGECCISPLKKNSFDWNKEDDLNKWRSLPHKPERTLPQKKNS